MATWHVKIFIVEGNFVELQFYKKMKAFEEETHALLRFCLEKKLALEWTSKFDKNDNKCTIQHKMEGLNDI